MTRFLILTSLFLLVLLPASSFLNIKIAFIFISMLFFLGQILLKRKIKYSSYRFLIFQFVWFLFLLVWVFYSICHDAFDFYNHLRAFSGYVGCLIYFLFIVVSVKENVISTKDFFHVVIFGFFIYGVIKLCIILAPVFGLISVGELKETLFNYIGSVTYEYWRPDASIARISFGNDIVVPFMVALLLMNEHVSRFFNKYYLGVFYFLALVSGVFSFTRYIWILYIITFFIYFIFIKKMFKLGLVFAFLMILVVLFLLQLPWFYEIVSTRGGDVASLDMKSLQTYELLSYWSKNIFIGNGIGSFVPSLIRSEYQTYIYEVQWAALLMQFGMVGVFFIVLCLSGILLLVLSGRAKNKLYVAFIYILWLLSGLTNPYLFILSSSVIYISFWIVSDVKLWRECESSRCDVNL